MKLFAALIMSSTLHHNLNYKVKIWRHEKGKALLTISIIAQRLEKWEQLIILQMELDQLNVLIIVERSLPADNWTIMYYPYVLKNGCPRTY